MTVIVVAACPTGLRGHLTRWLLEISPGVFVGTINARVRELVWVRVVDMVKSGRAIMVYSANNEQGLAFSVHHHNWEPVDFEGVNLMLRPNTTSDVDQSPAPRPTGWSTAARRRKFGR
ncbi:type I-E CRISPR-associated endoribonuclease Cas2 [Prauserella marina]|uniref:CRISPR-associated protein Cas2 n=1 Tax=Prauserella marina TaxID=530584 RepID=A0A222VNH0_9PSEU|nr:type I-E CRISPR-associated endoribonuclease Cas2e [Prauserella marina]ASR35271.1 type I-E CRISPR-associated endoribonuclease Cas2 [Prauserella marina]PWV84953.1 CRISPR-associated Cas2 family protein [Prauserella marina]SDC08438.1 CRISPR-associated protein Cas2 [Prauserella marina]